MTDLAEPTVALAIPRPAEVADVYDLCTRTEAMLSSVTDVATAYDAKAKFAAIDQYLAQTSKDGRARLAATMRRLEARIGELLGESSTTQGTRNDLLAADKKLESPLSPEERSEFRLMAAHPEVVEEVIASSDDDAPASRRKVVTAIRSHVRNTEKETAMQAIAEADRTEQIRTLATLGLTAAQIGVELDLSDGRVSFIAREAGIPIRNSKLHQEERVELARAMAARGSTSDQIAEAIGIAANSMSDFRKRHSLEVPADAIVGKKRKLDSNRIVNATVESVIGIDQLLDAIDYSALDRSQLEHWVSSLSDAIRSLTTLRNNLKKEQTQ